MTKYVGPLGSRKSEVWVPCSKLHGICMGMYNIRPPGLRRLGVHGRVAPRGPGQLHVTPVEAVFASKSWIQAAASIMKIRTTLTVDI